MSEEPPLKRRKVSPEKRTFSVSRTERVDYYYTLAQLLTSKHREQEFSLKLHVLNKDTPRYVKNKFPKWVTMRNISRVHKEILAYLKDLRFYWAQDLQILNRVAMMPRGIKRGASICFYSRRVAKQSIRRDLRSTHNPANRDTTVCEITQICFPGHDDTLANLIADYTVDETLVWTPAVLLL